MIGVVNAANAVESLLNYSRRSVGIEIAKQVVSIFHDRTKFVAQAGVDRQVPAGPPVVLNECTVRPVMDIPHGITNLNRCFERIAGKKILQRGGVGSPRPHRPGK